MGEIIDTLYEYIPGFSDMRANRAHAMIEHLPPLHPNNRVLEIGTGKGDIYRLLCETYPNQIISLDIEDQVASLNRGVLTGQRLIADCLSIPFACQSIDVGFAVFVLHHLREAEATTAIKELLRVCKKVVVIEDLINDDRTQNSHWPIASPFYVRNVDRIINTGVPGGDFGNHRTDEEWQKVFCKAGAIITDTQYFSHPVLGFIPWEHVVFSIESRS